YHGLSFLGFSGMWLSSRGRIPFGISSPCKTSISRQKRRYGSSTPPRIRIFIAPSCSLALIASQTSPLPPLPSRFVSVHWPNDAPCSILLKTSPFLGKFSKYAQASNGGAQVAESTRRGLSEPKFGIDP